MIFARPTRLLAALLLLAPLAGCARMSDMFSGFNPFGMFQGKKLPATDAQGRRLTRGFVVSVRNVKIDPPPLADTESSAKDTAKQKPGRLKKIDALEYRVLDDDGATILVVTPGDETTAITPGERVLVVHGAVPSVMLETPLSDGQGV